MRSTAAERLRIIKLWLPPDGAVWTPIHSRMTGTIAIRIRVADLVDTFVVDRDPDNEMFKELIRRSVALLRRWRSRLQEQSREREVPWDDWLITATQRIRDVERNRNAPRHKSVVSLALWICIGLEAERIVPPHVEAGGWGSIRLHWARHGKQLSVHVKQGNKVEIQTWTKDALITRDDYTTGAILQVRNAMTWLYPEANAGHPGHYIDG